MQYKDLNSKTSQKPLAQNWTIFYQHYWPGKVICCGLKRTDAAELEKHITRAHRKDEPNMIFISPVHNDATSDYEEEEADDDSETNSSSQCKMKL